MNERWDYKRCKIVLAGEIELLKKISSVEGDVRKAVMRREWECFDEKNEELQRLGAEFAQLEEERALHFSALTSEPGTSWSIEERPFYAAILDLPVGERMELSRLYRELKMETLKMRALNETFMAYLNEAKNLAASYLEAVYPDRGGKLYTSKGRKVKQDLRSIVFNNRF